MVVLLGGHLARAEDGGHKEEVLGPLLGHERVREDAEAHAQRLLALLEQQARVDLELLMIARRAAPEGDLHCADEGALHDRARPAQEPSSPLVARRGVLFCAQHVHMRRELVQLEQRMLAGDRVGKEHDLVRRDCDVVGAVARAEGAHLRSHLGPNAREVVGDNRR